MCGEDMALFADDGARGTKGNTGATDPDEAWPYNVATAKKRRTNTSLGAAMANLLGVYIQESCRYKSNLCNEMHLKEVVSGQMF